MRSVLAGRVWCVACPFGALNEWSARASGSRRRLPGILRTLWWATGAFVLLTWADDLLGVVRSPGQECYRGGAAARGCPMFEFPQTMDRNNNCILVVALLQIVVVVSLFAVSLLAGHRRSLPVYADRVAAGRALVPFAVLSLVFTLVGIVVLNQPMGLRHGM